jgi:exosome complex component RRP42
MAPLAPLPPLLSPSELSYIHTSLSLTPPIRPDARPPTTFRPLTAETNLLPSCNGSARLCYADGSEAIVGVKAEVERTASSVIGEGGWECIGEEVEGKDDGEGFRGEGKAEWVEVTVDIPGQRDDEPVMVFLGAMLHEALVAEGGLQRALYISGRWHWKLYIDVRPHFLPTVPSLHPDLPPPS